MKNTKVAIIGAGLAGLYAARRIQAAGIDFVLIEARNRMGGRILSAGLDGLVSDDGFDLGPSWYWPHMQPAMAELIEELGLPTFCQNSDGDVIFERMSREPAQRYRGGGQDQQSMRVVGGTAGLIRALADGLSARDMKMGMRLTAMKLVSEGIHLSLEGSEGFQDLLVDHVIAALPPRLLEASVEFVPPVDVATARRWRDTPTWMAPHAKFFAVYERPFWREADLSGTAQSMVGPMVEMHDATTASGQAALFGFLGVGARQRAELGEGTLTAACIAQFSRIFGAEAENPLATLVKDWAADPFTATSEDLNAGGHIMPTSVPWVSGVWADGLTLAGSETSPTEPGYLAGAVAAAELAVTSVCARLADDA